MNVFSLVRRLYCSPTLVLINRRFYWSDVCTVCKSLVCTVRRLFYWYHILHLIFLFLILQLSHLSAVSESVYPQRIWVTLKPSTFFYQRTYGIQPHHRAREEQLPFKSPFKYFIHIWYSINSPARFKELKFKSA